MNKLIEVENLVIGAGMCGLTIGHRLSEIKKTFVILEKSKSVGGRIATRRRNEHDVFDHGAQFYKTSTVSKTYWDTKWSELPERKVWFKDTEDCVVSTKGLTQFPKSIADLNQIRFNEKVVKIDSRDDSLQVECQSGLIVNAAKVYLTCPLPQSLEILDTSQIKYPRPLKKIRYASALVGLFKLNKHCHIDNNTGFLRKPTAEIFSVSDQSKKLEYGNATYVVVMDSDWSAKNYSLTDDEIINEIQNLFGKFLQKENDNNDFEFTFCELKKWKYSHPLNPMMLGHFVVNNNVILAGDAFISGSINGATQSALSVKIT